MQLPNFRVQKAFTLLELMISISIIMLLAGLAVPSFNTYVKNQAIKQASAQVLSDLRSVQNKALTGDSSDKLISGVAVAYWGIKFVQNSSTYTVFLSSAATAAVCNDNTGTLKLAQNVIRMPEGFRIHSNSGCIFFDFAYGDVAETFSSNPIWVQRNGTTDSNTNNRKVINYNAFGLLY